jgi:hypothetical protein
MRDLDPTQYAEADRREVDPPIEVELAAWSPGGTLDWWVNERRVWWGRVRGAEARQRWISQWTKPVEPEERSPLGCGGRRLG